MDDKKSDEAIKYLQKAIGLESDNPALYLFFPWQCPSSARRNRRGGKKLSKSDRLKVRLRLSLQEVGRFTKAKK
nr:hypothetical protein [Pleurocapsa sp. FMAR1]